MADPNPPPDALAAPTLLHLVGRLPPWLLVADLGPASPGRPVPDAERRLGVHRLPDDPRGGTASLFGIRAPEGCRSVAVSVLGSAGADCRIDVALDRSGRCCSLVRDVATGEVLASGGDADGPLVDALHRVLGLSTPGPPPDAGHAEGWESLRRRTASGDEPCAGLLPDEADWMDATSFARWCTAASTAGGWTPGERRAKADPDRPGFPRSDPQSRCRRPRP